MSTRKKFTPQQALALQKASSHHDTKVKRDELEPGDYRVDVKVRCHGTVLILQDTVEVPRLDLWPVVCALLPAKVGEVNPGQILAAAAEEDPANVRLLRELLTATHRRRVKPVPKRGAVRGEQLHFERL